MSQETDVPAVERVLRKRLTTGQREKRSTTATSVGSSSRRSKATKSQSKSTTYEDPALVLAAATKPLLELFSVVDDVFTEPEAFAMKNIFKSLGRIYRAWKETRAQIDPEFDPETWSQELHEKD